MKNSSAKDRQLFTPSSTLNSTPLTSPLTDLSEQSFKGKAQNEVLVQSTSKDTPLTNKSKVITKIMHTRSAKDKADKRVTNAKRVKKLEKMLKKKLPLSRLHAVYMRGQRNTGSSLLNKFQLQAVHYLLRQQLKQHKVSKFKTGSEADNSSSNSEEEEIEELELNNVEQVQRIEANNVQIEDCPRTPEPNKERMKLYRKRLEETPPRKTMIDIPQYAYNSDDDLFTSY